ncbi:sulfite oxidase heme-binding subunit YedZ [Aestuariibacter sp. A3R04]|uniref:sulfite oxidase heme-binding subunit YedZ n=1 Tax=Aestuariibacter sp. A3R04 TaxID=2841571 RepID=UPI001C090629|nr:protein-methionine-sulfoxide reductase heme-binding subunit MsrQ [Aestuariibacter sp. A3R04]MBU3022732.1 sulfoxide reductase heme-binding subunit YedZ [Aestuariibacter sp. A3R04]
MKTLFAKPVRLTPIHRYAVKCVIHCFALGYVGWVFYRGVNDALGADPVEALLNTSGITALNLLLVSLAISPLAQRLPCGDLIKFRRLIGIYAFFYAILHMLTYISFELQLQWSLIVEELTKRPYIIVGVIALNILLALTVTSPMSIRRKMGKNWQRLHYLVYPALFLTLLHYTWSLKTGWQDPVFYWLGAILIFISRKAVLTRLNVKSFGFKGK